MPARLALLLLALVASGCDLSGRVESEIAGGLPDAIGPADRYEVGVEGLRASAGEASRVTILGERVRRDGAPVLDRLDLELTGVRYDRGERVLREVERARATVRVLPADLAAYLDERRGVREAGVRLVAPDRAVLRLRPEAGGFALPNGVVAEVEGRLGATGGQVRFDVEAVRAGGLNLGRLAAGALSDAVNPVLDLTTERPALEVIGVRVEGGALVLEATADLNGLRLR